MKTKLVLLIAILATLSSARAQISSPEALTATEHSVEHASLRLSETALAAAARPLDAALAADPKNPALLYESAFAHYAAVPALRVKKDVAAMETELEKAAALCERVKGQPWEAEALALHGGILGQLIGLKGGMSGMTLGPKSNQLLARAAKTLPAGPRVLFFRGLALLSTPPMFGGDPVEGTKLLQQSVDAFAKTEASAVGPHWGQADALAWLGVAKQKAGDLAAARLAWNQALEIEPDFGWVKFALLPSLDQPSKN